MTEIFHARAEELDAGGFLGILPALDQALVVFGKAPGNDKDGISARSLGLGERPEKNKCALLLIERAEKKDAVGHGFVRAFLRGPEKGALKIGINHPGLGLEILHGVARAGK